MCTALMLKTVHRKVLLGRTLDFSYPLQPHCYYSAPGYLWNNAVRGETIVSPYGFLGIGQELQGELAFFDGVNEHGFAAAALYFAGYAKYDAVDYQAIGKKQIGSYNFLQYILGNCASVGDLRAQIHKIHIIGKVDPLTQSVAPLHWIAVDRSGECVAIESTSNGIEILNNTNGVLANSPDLRWHITNLRNYMLVTPDQMESIRWGQLELTPFGQGGGTISLPGGYTSPERFVRVSYLKSHVPALSDSEDAVISFFQIMKSVSIPKGAVITARGAYDYTQYTACVDIDSLAYYFCTYDNPQIKKVHFPKTIGEYNALIDLGPIHTPFKINSLLHSP